MAALASDKTASAKVEPARRPRPATALATPKGDWLGAGCLNRIANETDRFKYEGRAEFTFSNPEGIRFEIITFSQTLGCRETGVPTLEHTWFPEHAWSFCQCGRCQVDLGWFYSGPHDFVGLIRNRLVPGPCVWN